MKLLLAPELVSARVVGLAAGGPHELLFQLSTHSRSCSRSSSCSSIYGTLMHENCSFYFLFSSPFLRTNNFLDLFNAEQRNPVWSILV